MCFYITNIYNALISVKSSHRADAQCDYYLKALAAVKPVRTKLQSGALSLEISCRNKLLSYGKDEANAMLAIAKLSIAGPYIV